MRQTQHTELRAGVAKVDITCRQTGAWRDLLNEKVQRHIPPDYLSKDVRIADPMFARALVVDDGREQLVLVTMDVTAIGARTISQNILSDSADDFVARLRVRVQEELGIPGGSVSVNASHSHQVPRMLCDDQEQIERTLQAIRLARQNMVAVKVGVGSGKEDRLTINRTMMLKDGTDRTIRSFYAPMPADEEVEQLRPIDPEIGIVRIDRTDGQPLAVVYNFACHLLLGAPDGTQGAITADHVGVTERYLEDQIGGGVMAFFLQGALGDAHEICGFDTDHPFTALDFGTRLGESVLRAYREVATSDATVRVASRKVNLPVRKDIPTVIQSLKQKRDAHLASLRYTSLNFKAFLPLYLRYSSGSGFPSHFAFRYMHAEKTGEIASRHAMDDRNRSAVQKYLGSIRTMEELCEIEENIATMTKHQEIIDDLGAQTVAAEFQGMRIGDAVFITAPMEILTETGLKLKKKSPFARTFVVSLSNGYLHYAPPPAYYARGGYEVTECLLAPEWEQHFDAVVKELFQELAAN
jgi:hypothetical protein